SIPRSQAGGCTCSYAGKVPARPSGAGTIPKSKGPSMKKQLPLDQSVAQDNPGTPPVSVPREPRRPELCNFTFADGRSCRMLRAKKHKFLCVFHAREERE